MAADDRPEQTATQRTPLTARPCHGSQRFTAALPARASPVAHLGGTATSFHGCRHPGAPPGQVRGRAFRGCPGPGWSSARQRSRLLVWFSGVLGKKLRPRSVSCAAELNTGRWMPYGATETRLGAEVALSLLPNADATPIA